MKLRRAMVTAAATAAIVPLALLSAPVAFADTAPTSGTSSSQETSSSQTGEGQASDGDTGPGTGTGSEADSGSQGQDSQQSEDSKDEGTTEGDGTAQGDGTTQEDNGSQEGNGGQDDTKPGEDDTKPGQPGDGKPSPSKSTPEEPSEDPSECPVDEDGVDVDSQLSLDVTGLPGKIVAGSGWHTFKLRAANHSDKALGTVQWLAAVDNDSMSDDEDTWLSEFAQLQFFNPQTKAWESIADQVGNGFYFGETTLGARQTVDIKLRVNIARNAPVGDGYTVGLGGYVDSEKNCVHNAFALFEFTVLKPGSSNDDPGTAKPGKAKPGKGEQPGGGKQPQGGAEELPATGSLAETGSSSALPVIGAVGGIAVLAGAGVVFAVRRRSSGAHA
ncbi:LAETG motif-containing sortase-dependent surface protein [Streptomyces longwoodensis]|uniref:LAETG motif-containing sortase-dependent surface protein n=1 Tax=Streptomyces longwoodensis TaxID=68231 RepID=UPI0030E22806